MPLTMYQASAPVFLQGLKALSGVLDKTAAHVEARKIEPSAILAARLYPDMLTFTRQVQIACDFAKGATSRLAGQEVPAWDDNEASFEDLKARVARTIAHIESIGAEAIEGSEERDIELVRRGETTVHKGQAYLLQQAMPNFYFHLTTAYDIARHNGVEIGKRDFLGTA
jgi:hypothetical protein